MMEITDQLISEGMRILKLRIQPDIIEGWMELMNSMLADEKPEDVPGQIRVARMFARAFDAFFREMKQAEAALAAENGR